jgi:hypothetical protein
MKGFTMRSAWSSSTHQRANAGLHRFQANRQIGRGARLWHSKTALAGIPLLALAILGTAFAQPASAAQTVQLGTATPFAVLAGSAVTDIPTSSITGNVGLSPAAGTNITGLTQAEVTGTIYSTNGTGPAGNVNDPARLTTAKNDLTTAYNAAAGQPPTSTFVTGDNQLGGKTLTAGVYAFGHAATANITAASPLVLNGQNDPNSVFVFQASSDLITASGSVVQLENGAQACNVFWQVGSSATLGSSSTFVGTLMASTSATLNSAATVQGRILASTGAVTLDANTITAPSTCLVTTPTTTTTTPAGTTSTSTPTGTGGTGTPTGTGGATTPTGSITTTGSLGSGEGSTGTGSAAGATGSSGVVPVGSPHTGFGGATHSRDDSLIALGALAIAGSAGLLTMGARRRQSGRKGKALPTSS